MELEQLKRSQERKRRHGRKRRHRREDDRDNLEDFSLDAAKRMIGMRMISIGTTITTVDIAAEAKAGG